MKSILLRGPLVDLRSRRSVCTSSPPIIWVAGRFWRLPVDDKAYVTMFLLLSKIRALSHTEATGDPAFPWSLNQENSRTFMDRWLSFGVLFERGPYWWGITTPAGLCRRFSQPGSNPTLLGWKSLGSSNTQPVLHRLEGARLSPFGSQSVAISHSC